jgi:hypothetical protein
MPISPVQGASGTTYQKAPGQPSQEKPASSPPPDPARFLRLVLYGFVVVLLVGALLALLPRAHIADTWGSGAENKRNTQSDFGHATPTDTHAPKQQGPTTTASNTSDTVNWSTRRMSGLRAEL